MLDCHTDQSCTLASEARQQSSPPDNCIGCHMPKREVGFLAHSSLTNHRITAQANEPFPEFAFSQTTAALPDLVHLNPAPGSRMSLLRSLRCCKLMENSLHKDRNMPSLTLEFSSASTDGTKQLLGAGGVGAIYACGADICKMLSNTWSNLWQSKASNGGLLRPL